MTHSKKNKAKLKEREEIIRNLSRVSNFPLLCAGPVRIKQLEDLVKEYKLNN